jgi:hypothetical protein
MFISTLIAALQLAPPWALVVLSTLGTVALCYAVLLLMPEDEV